MTMKLETLIALNKCLYKIPMHVKRMQDEEDHLYAIRIHNSSTKIDYDNREKSHSSFLWKREAFSVNGTKTNKNDS